LDADGDDNDGNNDEDGITRTALVEDRTSTFTATVSGAGYLQAWVDWNGDGDFLDPGEQVATNLQDNGSGDDVTSGDGTITFDVNVPAGAYIGDTFSRFRW
jgi:hypothetical protein